MDLQMLDSVSFRGTDSLQFHKESPMRISKVGLFVAGAALAALGGTATAQTGPFQYFALTPCRAVDTRTTARVTNAAFASFTIKGVCNVPPTAVAASLNVTV